LIEDEEGVLGGCVGGDELLQGGLLARFFPAVDGAPDVAVGGDFWWGLGVDAGGRPNVENSFEFGDEAGVDERRFAGAGGGVEQDNAFGDEKVAELRDFTVAPEDGFRLSDGAWAGEGVMHRAPQLAGGPDSGRSDGETLLQFAEEIGAGTPIDIDLGGGEVGL
jgi:hypothetical protein